VHALSAITLCGGSTIPEDAMKSLMLIGSWLVAAVLLSIALVTANPLASRAGEPAKQCAVGDRAVQKNRSASSRRRDRVSREAQALSGKETVPRGQAMMGRSRDRETPSG
jgi:hypothetical protein